MSVYLVFESQIIPFRNYVDTIIKFGPNGIWNIFMERWMWKKGSKESKINRKDRMSQFVYYNTIIYTTTATAAVAG